MYCAPSGCRSHLHTNFAKNLTLCTNFSWFFFSLSVFFFFFKRIFCQYDTLLYTVWQRCIDTTSCIWILYLYLLSGDSNRVTHYLNWFFVLLFVVCTLRFSFFSVYFSHSIDFSCKQKTVRQQKTTTKQKCGKLKRNIKEIHDLTFSKTVNSTSSIHFIPLGLLLSMQVMHLLHQTVFLTNEFYAR